ncbi:MAG: RsmE family RNA methyltransferase [bacterium]
MPKELFYVEPERIARGRLHLNRAESHHLSHVLRRGPGDRFAAADGQGAVYECEVVTIDKGTVVASICGTIARLGEPEFLLTLAVAIPRREKLEWVVEKGTEVGVSCFVPLTTERTVAVAKSVKEARCQKIALAAMKQSRRSILPPVRKPQPFPAFLSCVSEEIRLIAHEEVTGATVRRVLKPARSQTPAKTGVLCVGPEGGFTGEEIALARACGFIPIGLGPRRLRTETAAIIGAGLILELMGELG